ncbi:MAG: ornithine carbamoyltransferase [Chloroflexaceae bacterium]|jgi:ornithine carbamoyltransferase|nr:ornithine carbamoyltransferase [Chloroflexaceae bacterium]
MATATYMQMPNDLLRISDLSASQIAQLLDLAVRMRDAPGGWTDSLRGQSVACFFEKPSTRTRVSFAAAAYRLGMQPILLRPDELQLGRGETLADTARVLSSYASAIVIRTFAQHTLEIIAEEASVPVINALSDTHHPCQALADLLTIRDYFGRLDEVRLTYVGEGNNVAHSLLEAGALMGMHVTMATPPQLAPNLRIVAQANELARTHGGSLRLLSAPIAAVRDAQVVYTDVWVSMGAEAQQQEHMAALAPYQVNPVLLAHARPEAIFMHCLPAHRGQEVTPDVIDGPQSQVWRQAANRMHTEQALLYLLVTGTAAYGSRNRVT